MRLGRISGIGRVRLEFTVSMRFPDQQTLINLNKSSNNKLIDLIVLKGDSDELDENLKSWEIISVSSQLIEIDLEFEEPLYVSQGYNRDRLVV